MTPNLDPIRPTQSVLSWLIANRDGVLVGALVATAIVALMLVARMIGHRIVAKEAEAPTFGWKAIVGRVLSKTTVFFMVMAAVDIVNVAYKGSGGAVVALIGGEVQLMFGTTAAVVPNVKSGRLRALAITSARPSPLVPGIPALAASGVPGYEASQKAGLFAPAKTPVAIVNRLNQEVVALLNKPELKDRLLAHGVDVVTIGQYLQPSAKHAKIDRWVHPDEFRWFREQGEALGFGSVFSGPLVRSSYRADEQRHAAATGRGAVAY